jgi:hypothetical protein
MSKDDICRFFSRTILIDTKMGGWVGEARALRARAERPGTKKARRPKHDDFTLEYDK